MKRSVCFIAIVVFVVAGSVFAQAPGSAGPRPTPPPVWFVEKQVPSGKSIVYVYRPSNFAGSAVYPLVVSNGGPEGVLPSGRYLTIEADPGILKLGFASQTSTALTLDVVAGESYYVRFDFKKSSVVAAQTARTSSEILPCKEWKMGEDSY